MLLTILDAPKQYKNIFQAAPNIVIKRAFTMKTTAYQAKLNQSKILAGVASGENLIPILFIMLAILLGGASRSEVISTKFLNPVSVLFLTYALLKFKPESFLKFKVIICFVSISTIIMMMHMVPLPYDIWSEIPGRSIELRVVEGAIGSRPWLPLTMTPVEGLNSLYSISTPLAAFVLTLNAPSKKYKALINIIFLCGLTSAIAVVLQAAGIFSSFYKISSDTPPGIFANRNHQAVFLVIMMPILLFIIRERITDKSVHFQNGIYIFFSLVLVLPIIAVTGSRTGFFLGLAITPLAMLIFPSSTHSVKNKPRQNKSLQGLVVAALALIVSTLIFLYGRNNAIQRFQFLSEDVRVSIWSEVVSFLPSYLPYGSGLGSAAKVYQIHEPSNRLYPTYLNHLHNDWLEIALTLGLPGLALSFIAIFMFVRKAYILSREPLGGNPIARLGMCIVGVFAIASITDYPLRTPALAAVMAVALVWAALPPVAGRARLGQK